MRIEVSYSPAAGQVDRSEIDLPPGSTLAQAVEASGVLQRHPALTGQALDAGIWGRRQPADTLLRERDRVELYRPLVVDPKEARRLRFNGSRTTSRRARAAPRSCAASRRAPRARPGH